MLLPSFDRLFGDLLLSSSGWAHGVPGSYEPTPGVDDLRMCPPSGDDERNDDDIDGPDLPHEYMCE